MLWITKLNLLWISQHKVMTYLESYPNDHVGATAFASKCENTGEQPTILACELWPSKGSKGL